MQIVGLIVSIALGILFWAMWVRFFVDLTRSINPRWQPTGLILIVAESALTVTDPLVKTVRKVIPTVRLGQIGLDFGWTIVMVAIVIAQNLTRQLL
jgi:YggT family protein